ncbi:hypothetical protein P9209_22095 [Prescottella defluvii]|nr:hypothetical protein P9209_22095 [Prescottella defluvii]
MVELDRPERRDVQTRPPIGLAVDHVVGHDLGLRDGAAPVLEREELVPEQWVRRPGDVTGDEDVVGDEAVLVECPTACVARDAPPLARECGPREPLHVPDSAHGYHRDVGIDDVAVRQPRRP